MNRFLITAAAASTFALAVPAAAQGGYGQNEYRGGVSADSNLSARIGQLQARLQAGVQSGAISRREAMPLRQQYRALMQLERRYSRDGLSGQERADLQRRLRDLRQQIRMADGNRTDWERYDREDGYGGAGGYGDGRYADTEARIDANRDGYDDRDYNRNGRWDDDLNQQPARGGLGGLLDTVLGGGGLRIGQRASANLYRVPSQYQYQYRDSEGSYFRTDGRQIYQIDARTQAVVRIYPMSR